MASGDTAPTGPVSEQAKQEAMKLLRSPEGRQLMQSDPNVLKSLLPHLQAIGMVA